MSGALLSADDLRFINLVASRRFRHSDPEPAAALETTLAGVTGNLPHERAASLVAGLLTRGVFATAPAETALLAMTCQLSRDGLQLVAPQGAIVGMMQGLARGTMDEATVSRWLEDRAVPDGTE